MERFTEMAFRSLGLACCAMVLAHASCNSHRSLTRPSHDQAADAVAAPDAQTSNQPTAVGSGVSALAFSPDGAVIAAGNQAGSVLLLDASGQVRATSKAHTSAVNRVVFSRDGSLLVSASNDKSAKVMHAKGGGEKASFRNLDGRVTSAAFSMDAKRIAVAMKLVEVTEFEERTPDGRRVHKGAAGPLGRLVVFEVDSQRVLTRKDLDAVPADIAFSPDGSALAVGTRGGSVLLLDSSSLALRSTLTGPSEVHRLVFSKDGSLFAAAGIAVVGWKPDGTTAFTHRTPGANHVSVDVSPDGAMVAAASSFGKAVVLLRAASGEVVATIEHDPMPLSVAFSPDGATLVSAGADGKLRFWKSTTGEPR